MLTELYHTASSFSIISGCFSFAVLIELFLFHERDKRAETVEEGHFIDPTEKLVIWSAITKLSFWKVVTEIQTNMAEYWSFDKKNLFKKKLKKISW